MTRERAIWALLILGLLLPHFFTIGAGRPHRGFVCTGDEPHYLVMLHSAVRDFDLDLGNNYLDVHAGGSQAGRYFAGVPLDHHTVIEVDGRLERWGSIYHWKETTNEPGEAVHRRLPGTPTPAPGASEWSVHPPGILILAPLLLPFRGTTWIEPLALLLAACATLMGAWAFRDLARTFTGRPLVALVATLIVFLGTPVWLYSRSFYNEPFLLLLVSGAYALYLRNRILAASLLVAIGMQMKPPFLLIAIPLAVDLIVSSRWRDLARCALLPVASVLGVLVTNLLLFGSPWTPPQPFVVGNVLEGALGLLLHWTKGLLPLSPVLALALLGWVPLLRSHTRPALITLGGFLAYFGLMATWALWDGAWCYGPRLIVPVIPLLGLGLIPVLNWAAGRRLRMAAIAILGLGSMLIGGAAAFEPCRYMFENPMDRLLSLARLP